MTNKKGNVKLLSYWFSPYCKGVELSLNAKRVAFEYQEEDLTNKSELLLKSNPVLKKVPTLIHNGIPICESLIILEYIDETWTNSPKLIPEDSATRSKFRFWASFINTKVMDGFFPAFTSKGEEQKKNLEALSANIKAVEEGISTDFFGSGKRQEIGEKDINLVDVVIWSVLGGYEAFEAIELNILDAEKYPLTYSWVTKLNNLPVMQRTKAETSKIVSGIKYYQHLAASQGRKSS